MGKDCSHLPRLQPTQVRYSPEENNTSSVTCFLLSFSPDSAEVYSQCTAVLSPARGPWPWGSREECSCGSTMEEEEEDVVTVDPEHHVHAPQNRPQKPARNMEKTTSTNDNAHPAERR